MDPKGNHRENASSFWCCADPKGFLKYLCPGTRVVTTSFSTFHTISQRGVPLNTRSRPPDPQKFQS